ncbi:MAG: DUF2085 domain-containing protein [Acidobacteria bacterium]|nr:DUF2085 domain-containing protein [Acidobacteriota bacterium]
MNPFVKPNNRKAPWMYALLLLITLVWLAVIFLPPWLMASGHRFFAFGLYRGLSGICHQIPERSFHLWGFPLAVCSRCTGIYFGFLFGLMLYPFFRRLRDQTTPSRVWLAIAALPMLIDVGGNFVGLFNNTFFSRTATGLLAGGVAAFFVLPTWVAIVHPRFSEPLEHSFKEHISA